MTTDRCHDDALDAARAEGARAEHERTIEWLYGLTVERIWPGGHHLAPIDVIHRLRALGPGTGKGQP